MKAEETVMDMKQIVGVLDELIKSPTVIKKPELAIAQAQAEISWNKAIREVVEWLEQYAIDGGKVSLNAVLEDIRIHSIYGKPN